MRYFGRGSHAAEFLVVEFDKRKLKSIERQVRGIPGAMKRIMPRAINRTAKTARARTARKIAGKVKVRVSEVKKGIRILTACGDLWHARLIITTRRIPLIQFGARQFKKGVKYQISKAGGRKIIKGAFIQTMPITGATQARGHRGVFKRDIDADLSEGRDKKGRPRKNRLPIREKFGPSLGIVFEDAASIAAETIAETNAELEKNIDSQVRFLLSRRAG